MEERVMNSPKASTWSRRKILDTQGNVLFLRPELNGDISLFVRVPDASQEAITKVASLSKDKVLLVANLLLHAGFDNRKIADDALRSAKASAEKLPKKRGRKKRSARR